MIANRFVVWCTHFSNESGSVFALHPIFLEDPSFVCPGWLAQFLLSAVDSQREKHDVSRSPPLQAKDDMLIS